MAQYNVQFSIDGRRTQEIVSAYNTNDARKIIEARYTGAKIVIMFPLYTVAKNGVERESMIAECKTLRPCLTE